MTTLDNDLRHDYREQSSRYDSTRGVSPSVLGPVRDALVGVPGPVLLDVGGGTGNYAVALREEGPTLAELTTHLPGTTATPMVFTDLADASIGALCAHPGAMLDEQVRRQTSYFGRLERDNPAELALGLARLREMLERGEDPRTGREAARERLGDATVLSWRSPM